MTQPIPVHLQDFLQDFTIQIQSALPEKVAGIYLYGSLALGAFNERKSDIDFVVVLHHSLNKQEIETVKRVHRQLNQSSFGKRLDGMYIEKNFLGKMNSDIPPYPFCSEGEVAVGHWDVNAITWWILKNRGISLAEPSREQLNLKTTWGDVQKTLDYNLEQYWTKKAAHWWNFLLDEQVEAAVLTIARIICTIEDQNIVSKEDGFKSLKQRGFSEWKRLFAEVSRLRFNGKSDLRYGNRYLRAKECQRFVKWGIEHGAGPSAHEYC